jgi:CTP synthase
MQLAVLEYAQNVLKLQGASTEEINPRAKHLVIGVMPDQREKIKNKDMGGSMRLGEWPAVLKKGTIAAKAYKTENISERHRHRYEVNPDYVEDLKENGIKFSGTSPNGKLMEIMELDTKEHPFFVGVQFHPEFHARPLSPHPIFSEFVKASYKNSKITSSTSSRRKK